jgi:hypothetical protein
VWEFETAYYGRPSGVRKNTVPDHILNPTIMPKVRQNWFFLFLETTCYRIWRKTDKTMLHYSAARHKVFLGRKHPGRPQDAWYNPNRLSDAMPGTNAPTGMSAADPCLHKMAADHSSPAKDVGL